MIPPTLHGTAVAISGRGVLLLGASGSGKSDLALRLIDRGARLVADDRVATRGEGGQLWLASPPALSGLLEVRGVGILSFPPAGPVAAALVVQLGGQPDRLPEPASIVVDGIRLPLLRLEAFHATAAIKVELALAPRPELG